jgi:hypothetical protein
MVMGAPQSLVTAAFVFIVSSFSEMFVLCKPTAEQPNKVRRYSAAKNASVVQSLLSRRCAKVEINIMSCYY